EPRQAEDRGSDRRVVRDLRQDPDEDHGRDDERDADLNDPEKPLAFWHEPEASHAPSPGLALRGAMIRSDLNDSNLSESGEVLVLRIDGEIVREAGGSDERIHDLRASALPSSLRREPGERARDVAVDRQWIEG